METIGVPDRMVAPIREGLWLELGWIAEAILDGATMLATKDSRAWQRDLRTYLACILALLDLVGWSPADEVGVLWIDPRIHRWALLLALHGELDRSEERAYKARIQGHSYRRRHRLKRRIRALQKLTQTIEANDGEKVLQARPDWLFPCTGETLNCSGGRLHRDRHSAL